MKLWPYDCPGAGKLDTSDLDAACWRRRHITLTPEQAHDMDDTAGLCSSCGSAQCATPQACERAEPLPPVQPPRWVRELLAHPVRWGLIAAALYALLVWSFKP